MLNDAEEPVANLSGGEQKALAIARSLYFGVQVLILDEPTAALSIAEQGIVLEVVSLPMSHLPDVAAWHRPPAISGNR
jgi:ABC-type sugar transport system ATPase subunit